VCACVLVCVVFWFVDVLSVCVFFPVLGAMRALLVLATCNDMRDQCPARPFWPL
jgi:hypothetical protein